MGNKTSKTRAQESLPDVRVKKQLQNIQHELKKKTGGSHIISKMSDEDLKNLETDEKKLCGQVRLCKIFNIYDGDTATIVFYNEGKLECHKFRVYGYDSPEMRVPKAWDVKKRTTKKKQAKDAKNAFAEYTTGKNLVVDLMGKDKYGRVLGKLYAFPKDISDKLVDLQKYDVCKYMVENNYGYAYEGGKKRT